MLERTTLRASPAGRVVARIGTKTRFGSPTVLNVVARRGRWIGVLSEHVANGRTAWVAKERVKLVHEAYAITADLSDRRVTVRRDDKAIRTFTVAIGRPGSPTPTGRFAVTDAITLDQGSGYGCCAFALTGRQPNVPQGWAGGDRLAIHGTQDETSIGTPASAGCLRAPDQDLRWMLTRIPLGTRVTINP